MASTESGRLRKQSSGARKIHKKRDSEGILKNVKGSLGKMVVVKSAFLL
jgi:hypothetical protein